MGSNFSSELDETAINLSLKYQREHWAECSIWEMEGRGEQKSQRA